MTVAGSARSDSIAEHSFRIAIIGTVLAAVEGVDHARVPLLCVLHDPQETRITDTPHIGHRYLTAASKQAITADQMFGVSRHS